MAFSVHEVHSLVQRSLPKNAPMRGFLHAVETVMEKIREKGEWPFLQKQGHIMFVPSYSTGTIAVTNGSGAVVGSGTTFTSAMVGRRLRVGNEVYTITAFTNGTNITISPNWVGASASGLNYTIYQDTYALPSDCERLIKWWDSTNQRFVEPVPAAQLGDYINITSVADQWPAVAAQFGWDNQALLMFWPAPTTAALVPIWYYRAPVLPTGPNSTIDLPDFMRPAVVQGCRWLLLEQMAIDGARLESGVLEHQRNRFYDLLVSRWSIEQNRVSVDVAFDRGTDRYLGVPPAPYFSGPIVGA